MYVHIKQYDGFNNWLSHDFDSAGMMKHIKQFKRVPRENMTFHFKRGIVEYNPIGRGYWELWVITDTTGENVTYTLKKRYVQLKSALNALERVNT